MVVVVLGCAVLALRARWDEAGAALVALSPWTVAGALAAALAGLGTQMLAWRALLADLGSPLPVPVAARVMFVGQLGKYVPGSVWAFLAQVELARDRAVPRYRAAAATVLAIDLSFSAAPQQGVGIVSTGAPVGECACPQPGETVWNSLW